MSDHPYLQYFRKEGWLDLHSIHLCNDLKEMGGLDDSAMFWLLSLMIANSAGSLCIPVHSPDSRLEAILGAALSEEALQWWMEQRSKFNPDSFRAIMASMEEVASSGIEDVPYVPLIHHRGFLFFQAHYYYRQKFLKSVQSRQGIQGLIPSEELLDGLFRMLQKMDLTAEQAYAVLLAGTLPMVLVTGGPGSGKTSTIYAILKVAMESGIDPQDIRIAAPTGRAASRVLESLEQRARIDPSIQDSILQVRSSTIHRLLGVSPSGYYHDADLPLPARLLVIDELSMVDVTLMGRLLEAVDPARTTLVLLGDPDQLPSVEAGAVLQDFLRIKEDGDAHKRMEIIYSQLRKRVADLPESMEAKPAFSVFLKGSHRFGGALMDFASELREGKLSTASLEQIESNVVNGVDLDQDGVQFIDSSKLSLVELLLGWMENASAAQFGPEMDLEEAFTRLNSMRILSPVRKGPAGVEAVNRACSQIVMDRFGLSGNPGWFSGMPVMLHRNDNIRRLYNGDTGIVAPAAAEPRAYFPSASESRQETTFRSFQRDALPEHEPAFCHTIHKSQGSEYDAVLILLDSVKGSRQRLNRELLYTAITRARKKCILYGNASEIADASRNHLIRETGLHIADS